MARTLLCSLAGAGAGFLVGLVFVLLLRMTAGAQPLADLAAISIFVGGFLAAAGAIVGAIIGGVSDLLAYFSRRDEALEDALARRDSKSEP